MEAKKRTVRTSHGIREYTYLGCPLTRNRSPWCFRICVPEIDGSGQCGRVAPHGFKSRIQAGIADHKKKLLEEHFRKLENMYIAGRCNRIYDPGNRISEGAADVVIPVREEFFHAAGAVHGSVYFKAMDDAAFFAVNSLVEDVFVLTVNFNTYLSRPVSGGVMIARGQYVGRSGEQYLADAVLMDSDGNEIGRGSGSFVKSKIPLSPDIGYE